MVSLAFLNLMHCPILLPHSLSALYELILPPHLPHISVYIHPHVTCAPTLSVISAIDSFHIHSFVLYHVRITNAMVKEQWESQLVRHCVHYCCPTDQVTYALPLQVPIHTPFGLPDFPFVQDVVYHTKLHGLPW